MMNIFRLHNVGNRVDGLYLTFLHYQSRKKTCLLTLISECEAANSILVWKQTELILDPDNVPKANHSWFNSEMPRVADKSGWFDIYAAWLHTCWLCSLFLGRTLPCLGLYWGFSL